MIAADTLITDVKDYTLGVCQQARQASAPLARSTTAERNKALMLIADKIDASKDTLISENKKDLDAGRLAGLDDALIDRLELTPARIGGMSEGLRQIASLPDPIGGIDDMSYRPSGIQVGKMRVPLGVIGIIYESRPNVTADAAGLCLKSGNACVLRGGSEAIHSNQAIASLIADGLKEAGLPEHACQVLATTDRAAVGVLLTSSEYVDVIIPRGGKGLIKRVMEDAKVPVIKHLDGICHVYIDAGADLTKAMEIAFNAKTHRYGVCNAMETLLVHEDIADKVLPGLVDKYKEKQVELRGCEKTLTLFPTMKSATEEDWATEYLAPILSIRIVDSMEAAISHINTYSSQHTDCIVTRDHQHAMRFVREVDSSSVMVNASTRFADGFEYGLGAEIGISTDKFHVRGPVGLEGLTSQKYVVLGDGHIRQ